MPDYVQGRTGDNAAVAFRSVMLHLLSDIIPALRAKPCHFNLKLFSVHIFYCQGNYLFIKSSLQGSCFSYLNCLPLPSLSCSSWKQSWFSKECFAFFFSLPVMIWSALVLYSWEGRVKSCFQIGFPIYLGMVYKTDGHPTEVEPTAALLLPLEMWAELNRDYVSFPINTMLDQSHLHGNSDCAVYICFVQPALLYHTTLLGAQWWGILKESKGS